jgi:hypothetical protein
MKSLGFNSSVYESLGLTTLLCLKNLCERFCYILTSNGHSMCVSSVMNNVSDRLHQAGFPGSPEECRKVCVKILTEGKCTRHQPSKYLEFDPDHCQ